MYWMKINSNLKNELLNSWDHRLTQWLKQNSKEAATTVSAFHATVTNYYDDPRLVALQLNKRTKNEKYKNTRSTPLTAEKFKLYSYSSYLFICKERKCTYHIYTYHFGCEGTNSCRALSSLVKALTYWHV